LENPTLWRAIFERAGLLDRDHEPLGRGEVYRWKESGELAYEHRATIDYLIRNGNYEITITES
jgi:hypothetical protein